MIKVCFILYCASKTVFRSFSVCSNPQKLKRIRSIHTWAPSSEFVSSSIPSWQILTAHAQPFRGARDLAFCLKVPLDSLLVWASSKSSGETARMRRLAWTFAARIGDKYQIRLTWPILKVDENAPEPPLLAWAISTKFAWRGPISFVKRQNIFCDDTLQAEYICIFKITSEQRVKMGALKTF